MKILTIADIHGHQDFDDNITGVISNADLILIAGDITNFGNGNDAKIILENILRLNKKILAIPGNCDLYSVNHTLTSLKINLHAEMKKIDEIALYGIGGCVKTPFNTPQEYKESEIEEILNAFERQEDVRFHILVSHSPPANTKLDKTSLGQHVGSKTLRNFIEKFQADLVICGHIHEARGIDKIGRALIINPGTFPKHYAVINIAKEINYELR